MQYSYGVFGKTEYSVITLLLTTTTMTEKEIEFITKHAPIFIDSLLKTWGFKQAKDDIEKSCLKVMELKEKEKKIFFDKILFNVYFKAKQA